MVTAIAERIDERLVGHTSQGIPIILAEFAADVSDLSALEEIRRTEAEIMQLPPELRNDAWNALSPVLESFSRNEASFKALEQLYTRDGVRFNGLVGVDDHGVAKSWFECYTSARCARERGSITRRLVVEGLGYMLTANPSDRIKLVSIASGSARCVIEAISKVGSKRVTSQMIDWDLEARTYSEDLARKAGISDQVLTIAGDVLRIARYVQEVPVNLVEAVGILDYLDDRLAIHLLRQVYKILYEDGSVIASNVMPNEESEFLHTAIGWRPMYYRSEDYLTQLFIQAGFASERAVTYRAPHGVFCVVEFTKQG